MCMRLRSVLISAGVCIFTLALTGLFLVQETFAQFPVGHRTITFVDPARNNRQVPAEIYYPAVAAGNNTTLASGAFPVIVFGHGFLMPYSSYAYFRNAMVPDGYFVVFPTTEGTLVPNHLNFGLDLAFLVIAGRPPLDIVVRALPFLPVVLLGATLNAFYEEMTYKASYLSVLEGVVGKPQSLLLLAAYFGILHFYGIPYGIIGVVLAAFLGWVLGKSMLETRGLFWAWFLHFLQDVWIFAFLAIGSITPGG